MRYFKKGIKQICLEFVACLTDLEVKSIVKHSGIWKNPSFHARHNVGHYVSVFVHLQGDLNPDFLT